MSKKNKFDLTWMVHHGYLKDGETLQFVSDPNKTCQVTRQPNGEYKVVASKETMTLHAFAQRCLNEEPTFHAAKWVCRKDGKILYDLWHEQDYAEAA